MKLVCSSCCPGLQVGHFVFSSLSLRFSHRVLYQQSPIPYICYSFSPFLPLFLGLFMQSSIAISVLLTSSTFWASSLFASFHLPFSPHDQPISTYLLTNIFLRLFFTPTFTLSSSIFLSALLTQTILPARMCSQT